MIKGLVGAAVCLMVLGGSPVAAATPAETARATLSASASSSDATTRMAQRGDRGERRMHDDRRRFDGPRYDRGRRIGPGRSYRGPPPGWRRYQARPRGWQTRGCMQIGPLWYCP